MTIIEKPSVKESVSIIKEGVEEENDILIVGNCYVDYDGRASSTLDYGERIIILKEDGTLMIHTNENWKPVNWNPSPTITNVWRENNKVIVKNKRKNKEERIIIKIKEVKLLGSFELKDDEEVKVEGTEEDLKQHIINNPSYLMDNLEIITEEKNTDYGAIDLFGRDKKSKNPIVIELKRRKGSLSDVSQLKRYVKTIKTQSENPVEGILVASGITNSAKKMIEDENFKFIKRNPKEI